ncbi:MAG: hypothetical protein HYV63_21940, partial [Candidatus Schekmanbacteria bacterium]|nr:hypothetical protein [Candidatus Schekmanbacteria bacterium]
MNPGAVAARAPEGEPADELRAAVAPAAAPRGDEAPRVALLPEASGMAIALAGADAGEAEMAPVRFSSRVTRLSIGGEVMLGARRGALTWRPVAGGL